MTDHEDRSDPAQALEHAFGVLLDGDDERDAVAAFEALIARFPYDVRCRIALAHVLKGFGRLDEAVEQALAAVAQAPDDPPTLIDAARLFGEIDELESAWRLISAAGEMLAQMMVELADVGAPLRARMGHPEEARAMLAEALTVAPGDPIALEALEALERERDAPAWPASPGSGDVDGAGA